MNNWEIHYFSLDGQFSPVKRFINSLDIKTQARVSKTFDLLEEYGFELPQKYFKKIQKTPLWELRVIGGQSIRFFYVSKKGNVFFILHGFIKKSQKTPRKEIQVASKRLQLI